jgi:hypothetical protein
MNTLLPAAAAAVLLLAASAAGAASVTYAGALGDPGNPYLRAADLGLPDFTDDAAIANNVALYPLRLTQAGTLTITSGSFGAGGIDPSVTLFAGSDLSATFAASATDDFTWSSAEPAGWYWVAISEWDDYSFAENLGMGTLGDGFIGLGQAGLLGDGTYSVTVTLDTGTPPVPEPAPAWLLGVGLLALTARLWRVGLSPSPAPRRPR